MRSDAGVTNSVDATARVANFVAKTGIADLPDDVVTKARLVILDTFGAMLAAGAFPVGRIVIEHVAALGGAPDSRVVGTGLRVSAPLAALANGTLAHGLDFDDHRHLSTHTLPAALAVGELVGATTARVLLAYVLGREVGAKLGAVLEAQRKNGGGPTYRGWYRVGVVGPVAAAVSSAVVLGSDAETLRHAIGIAASSSSGLRRNQGTMTKALHAGNAASDGVHAALLAARGFTADTGILESELGLVTAMCLPGEADWSALDRLGAPFDLSGPLAVKRYPACSPSHKPVAAILELRRRHGFAPDDIDTIDADLHPFSLMRTDPVEAIATGYSLPYLLAVAVLDGQVGLAQVGGDRLHDPRVRSLMDRVRHDPAAAPHGAPERVTVRLRDGRVLIAEQDGKPDLREADSVRAKYRTCAGSRLDPEKGTALAAAIDAMPGDHPITHLLDLTETDAVTTEVVSDV